MKQEATPLTTGLRTTLFGVGVACTALALAACGQTEAAQGTGAQGSGGNDGVCALASPDEISQFTTVPMVEKAGDQLKEVEPGIPFGMCFFSPADETKFESIIVALYPAGMVGLNDVNGGHFANLSDDQLRRRYGIEPVEGLGMPAVWVRNELGNFYLKIDDTMRLKISGGLHSIPDKDAAISIAKLVIPRLNDVLN